MSHKITAAETMSTNWHTVTMRAMRKHSTEALRYILKDATEAATLGWQIGNPKAGYYADEAHYANMELVRRGEQARVSGPVALQGAV